MKVDTYPKRAANILKWIMNGVEFPKVYPKLDVGVLPNALDMFTAITILEKHGPVSVEVYDKEDGALVEVPEE